MAASEQPAYRAPALDKGLDILELLAASSEPVSVVEMTSALGRNRTEIYRMMVALETRRYIERNDDGRYQLTDRLFDLAMRHSPKRSVDAAAKPVMQDLAERTLQSCHLMVCSGDHMICIARQESPASIGFSVQVGFRAPILHSTSGRLYFGLQNRSRQALLVKRLRKASSDKAALSAFTADAEKAATRGFVLEPSRLTKGIQDISAPILDPGPGGEAVACLTMPFISHLLFPITLEEAIPLVVEASQEITRRLRSGGKARRAPS